MTTLTPDRWRCRECHSVTHEVDMLHAPNPFDPEDILSGCPGCKTVDSWIELCDECDEQATCGTPTSDGGYRRTCYDHRPSRPS